MSDTLSLPPIAIERRSPKRGPKGARKVHCDHGVYAPDEIEFMKAMDQFKRDNRCPFPSWSEVLQVLKDLGYKKESGGV